MVVFPGSLQMEGNVSSKHLRSGVSNGRNNKGSICKAPPTPSSQPTTATARFPGLRAARALSL